MHPHRRRSKTNVGSLLRLATAICLAGLAACESVAEPPHVPAPLSIDQARAFGERIEASLNECDPKLVEEIFDVEHLLGTTLEGTSLSTRERALLLERLQQSVGLPRQLCEGVVQTNARLRFLHAREEGGKVTILIRSLSDQGLNYLEFFAGRRPEGTPRIYDFLIYITGEKWSETIRSTIDIAAGELTPGELSSTARWLGRANQHLLAGEYRLALASLRRLPADAQSLRVVRLLVVRASSGLGEEEYEQAISDYEASYPNDPSLDLVSIDGHYLRGQYHRAVETIDALDERVGGDPYLDVLAASAYLETGNFDAAQTRIEAALDAEPDLEDAYWTALIIALAQGDLHTAIGRITELRDRFAVEFDASAMAQEPLYADLLDSPLWAAWLRRE